VIGGAGFVGSHLVDRLLTSGCEVDVVDELVTGSLANLAEARAMSGMLRIQQLDARRPELAELVARRRPAVIYVLAPYVDEISSAETIATWLAVVLASLDAARRSSRAPGDTKVVAALPGSAFYGDLPTRDLPAREDGPRRPSTVAGVAAGAVVELLALHRDVHSVEFTAVAMASVYGTRRTAPIVGDPRATRDLVHVDEAAEALVRAGVRAGGLVVNVGSGTSTPLSRYLDASGQEAVPGGSARNALAPARARLHLGWSPWVAIEDGLAGLAPALDAPDEPGAN
jgi:UDP-glucose 4-epimerase